MRARAELGVGYKAYVEHEFYALSDAEQMKLAEALNDERAAKDAERDQVFAECAADLAQASGLAAEDAERLLREANNRLGVGPKTYVRHRFDLLSFAEQESEYERILARSKKRAAQLDKRAKQVALMSNLGYDEACDALRRARTELGVGYALFVEQGFFNMDWPDQVAAADKLRAQGII